MPAQLEEDLNQFLKKHGLSHAPIRSIRECQGGCIHQAKIIEVDNGELFFVKLSNFDKAMLEQEAIGLAALAEFSKLRSPKVLARGPIDERTNCLVLEAIRSARPVHNFWQIFGSHLAELHRNIQHEQFGWPSDNYIGSNPQPNGFRDDWHTFFGEMRLRFQMDLAIENGRATGELVAGIEKIIARLPTLLATSEASPCLIHGDLWSGNYMADDLGLPVLIDPACSFSHREAELSLPLLFGGFPSDFFDSYNDAWPLESNWRERVELYKLYHLLNHLNLFGCSYLDSCLQIVRRFTQ